jgi:hydroxyacylglutathione hydrolase
MPSASLANSQLGILCVAEIEPIMLYDTTADVIRKALRGLGLAPSEAAKRADLPEREVLAASRSQVSPDVLVKLAATLHLNSTALAALPSYLPAVTLQPSITQLEVPFEAETVNAWLIESGAGGHVLFDTGDGNFDVRRALEKINIVKVDVFITHGHHDHVGGLSGLKEMIHSLAGPDESQSLRPGDELQRGRLSIRVVDLPGHFPCAVGYVVTGLNVPICVTGDALFAGSIGGCPTGDAYQQALRSLRAEVMTLPDESILLPGHGPATTVGSERIANPFLAAK